MQDEVVEGSHIKRNRNTSLSVPLSSGQGELALVRELRRGQRNFIL